MSETVGEIGGVKLRDRLVRDVHATGFEKWKLRAVRVPGGVGHSLPDGFQQ